MLELLQEVNADIKQLDGFELFSSVPGGNEAYASIEVAKQIAKLRATLIELHLDSRQHISGK